MPLIRPSRDEDVPAIAAIYEHHVLFGTGTFETEAPSFNEMSARRTGVLAKGLPCLVLEENGVIAGFAYATWFKARHIVILQKTLGAGNTQPPADAAAT